MTPISDLAKLVKWVDECISKGQGGEKLHHFRAMYGLKNHSRTVDEWEIPEGTKISDVTSTISNVLQADANSQGGRHHYTMYAWFGDGMNPTKSLVVQFIGIAADDGHNVRMGGLEDTSLEGQVGQQMRHVEAMAALYFPEVKLLLENKDEYIASLKARVAELEDKVDGFNDLRERLANEDHKRMLELRKTIFNEHLKEQAIEFVAPMVPMLINHMTGQKLLPDTTSSIEQMIRAFMITLKPEQLQGLMGVLNPQQQAIMMRIMSIFQTAHEDHQEKMKKKGAPPMDHRDIGVPPAAGAAGHGPGRPGHVDVKVTQQTSTPKPASPPKPTPPGNIPPNVRPFSPPTP